MEAAAALEVDAPRAVIPQLRPAPGERPLAWDVPRRRVQAPVRDEPEVRAQPRGRPVRNVERPAERPVERHAERPVERDIWLPVEGLAERHVERPVEMPVERPIDRGWDDFRHAVHDIERDRPRPRFRPMRPADLPPHEINQWAFRQQQLDEAQGIQDPLAIQRQYWGPAFAIRQPAVASFYYIYAPQHPGNNTLYYRING